MKTRTLVSISIFVLALSIITGGCYTFSTRIHRVAERGDLFKVKKFIEEGTDVNAQDKWGHTALMFASCWGHTEVVKLLIEAGADVNAQPKVRPRHESLGPALIDASAGGHTEVVKLLIEAGADVNAKSAYGYTALMRASAMEHTEVVKLLKEAGAKE